MPLTPYWITHAAMLFAAVTALTPEDVGVSVDPNAETTSEIPASLYSRTYWER